MIHRLKNYWIFVALFQVSRDVIDFRFARLNRCLLMRNENQWRMKCKFMTPLSETGLKNYRLIFWPTGLWRWRWMLEHIYGSSTKQLTTSRSHTFVQRLHTYSTLYVFFKPVHLTFYAALNWGVSMFCSNSHISRFVTFGFGSNTASRWAVPSVRRWAETSRHVHRHKRKDGQTWRRLSRCVRMCR